MLYSGHILTSAKWNGIIASLHLLAVLLLIWGIGCSMLSSLSTTTPRVFLAELPPEQAVLVEGVSPDRE